MTPSDTPPAPEARGRTEFRRGQRLMQRRAAAVPMEMAAGLSDEKRQLLARVAEAILMLEVKA